MYLAGKTFLPPSLTKRIQGPFNVGLRWILPLLLLLLYKTIHRNTHCRIPVLFWITECNKDEDELQKEEVGNWVSGIHLLFQLGFIGGVVGQSSISRDFLATQSFGFTSTHADYLNGSAPPFPSPPPKKCINETMTRISLSPFLRPLGKTSINYFQSIPRDFCL